MTFIPAKVVIANLREKIEKLKDQLDAVRKWHKAQLGNEVDPQDIYELSKILEEK